MQITLKKTLIASLSLLAAIFFFLVIIVPVSRTITLLGQSTTYSGSLIGVLTGDAESIAMVKSQVKIDTSSIEAAIKTAEQLKEAQDALVAAYSAMAVAGIILFALTVLGAIGSFFVKTPRAARFLTIPFLALDTVLFLVIMIFSVLMTASTDMALKGVEVSISVPTVFMYVIGVVVFAGMLISSGVVGEKVLYGKKR